MNKQTVNVIKPCSFYDGLKIKTSDMLCVINIPTAMQRPSQSVTRNSEKRSNIT